MGFFKKLLGIFLIVSLMLWVADVLADRKTLSQELVRLHVVAQSDSREDQQVKLQVRDALVEFLQEDMPQVEDGQSAREYLTGKLDQLKRIADRVLQEAGCAARAVVTLTKEAFEKRDYDTFSLPAGVYSSLRVTIGSGEGQNWWCVVFPSLCMPATAEGFADTAAGAGFDETLTGTLQQERKYTLRFFLLDWLGWLENLLFR